MDVVDECQFDGAYTFIYSKREGTPASKMVDKVSLEEKEERLQRLNEKINKYSNLHNQQLVNKNVKVLILGVSEKKSDKVYGYTEDMKLVNVLAPKKTIGNIILCHIDEAKSFSLDGHIMEE